jgi:hypothetical protein
VRSVALATDPVAHQAAVRALEAHGTSTDALVAGFFAAAGARADVLLSPVQLIVAGPGVGPRVYDGRSRQPGRGVPRPRGFLREQEIPDAARVAAPGSIAACAIAHAGDGKLSFSRLVRYGVEIAGGAGAKARAAALERIARGGAAGLRGFARPLVAVAGRSEGGVLSEDDLAGVRPASARPLEIGSGKSRRTIWIVPWPAPAGEQRSQQIIVAADVRGVVGVLSWSADERGVAIPDLELTAPRDAVAVRRGVTRVRPGEPLSCPAPIAIAGDRGVAVIALGVPRSEGLDARRMAEAWQTPNTAALDLVPEGGIGVVRSLEADDARPLRRAPR